MKLIRKWQAWMKKYGGLSLVMMGVMTTAAFTFLRGNVLEALWWPMLLPLSFFLTLGTWRYRLVNAIPLVTLWVYVWLSLRLGNFAITTPIFYITPWIALVLKPRRHPVKYLTLGINTVLILLDVILQVPFSTGLRVLIVMSITVIFFPPRLIHYVKTRWRKLKNTMLLKR